MKKSLIAITATTLLLAGTAYADNKAEFGTVDMQHIIQTSSKIKSMQTSFQAQAKPMQAKLQSESQTIQTLRKDPKQAAKLKTAQAQFQKDIASFQAMQKQQQQQMKTLLMTSIDKVRVKEHLKAIFPNMVVLASDPDEFMDVTSMVEKQINHS